jgi:hypothetical protein
LIGIRLTSENPLAAREPDAIDLGPPRRQRVSVSMKSPAMFTRFHGHSRRATTWKIVGGMAQNVLKTCHFVPLQGDVTKATTPNSALPCGRAIRENTRGTRMKLCHNGKTTGPSPRWSRLRAHDFYENEPTRTASASSTKRTHGARAPVENRANEPIDGPEKFQNQCSVLTLLPPSVPLNSGIFRKTYLIFKIGDERPRKPCHLVPNSATRSRQCNDPLSAGIWSDILELFAHTVAYSLVRFERRREWVPAPGFDCRFVSTVGSPDRSCGIHSPRAVDYGAGVKQLGFETSGDMIGKEGFL